MQCDALRIITEQFVIGLPGPQSCDPEFRRFIMIGTIARNPNGSPSGWRAQMFKQRQQQQHLLVILAGLARNARQYIPYHLQATWCRIAEHSNVVEATDTLIHTLEDVGGE